MTSPPMELRRPKEGMPTEADFYYGKPAGLDYPIAPMNVKIQKSTGELYVWMSPDWIHPVNKFDWYGKVPTCVESKL